MTSDNTKGCVKAFGTLMQRLTIIFTALQATRVIRWTWWQVLAPLIALYGIWLGACIVLGIYAACHKDEDE